MGSWYEMIKCINKTFYTLEGFEHLVHKAYDNDSETQITFVESFESDIKELIEVLDAEKICHERLDGVLSPEFLLVLKYGLSDVAGIHVNSVLDTATVARIGYELADFIVYQSQRLLDTSPDTAPPSNKNDAAIKYVKIIAAKLDELNLCITRDGLSNMRMFKRKSWLALINAAYGRLSKFVIDIDANYSGLDIAINDYIVMINNYSILISDLNYKERNISTDLFDAQTKINNILEGVK